MSDPPKKTRPIFNVGLLNNMVATNKQKRNINSSQPQKKNRNENGASPPRPLLDCLQPGPLLTSKPFEKSMSQRRRKNKPFDNDDLERSNDDQVNKPEISPGKNEIGRSTIDIREPIEEHLLALKKTFVKILAERSLSENSLKQRQFVFNKLRQVIIDARPDCQVNLYGSVYFECCLERPGVMDIDVQFKQTQSYDTLKELMDIIKKCDLYKEARIDTEYKPSCINLITNEPNMRVKLTSGYTRGIHLSKLIRMYIKFDSRLIQLLRLFRILTKTCNIDRPELGTLHPIVYHIMVIHFLQQVEPPVLPCLHEYAYGIDHVPITLNDNQYPEFFQVCKKYSQEWKSENQTNIEMLLLQTLSYYVKTFNTKQFVVSIQTRMPIMKIDNNWHSRKLLVEDPTDVKRSLCQTMQSLRSIDYFRETLNASLNYFGRKQKKTKKPTSNKCTIDNDDDLIEVIDDEKVDLPTIEQTNLLHNSYKLFYKRLPPTVARDVNIKQTRVREYYRQTFDNYKYILPKGIIKLNLTNKTSDEFDENLLEEAFQHDLENDYETTDENDDDRNENHSHLLINEDDEQFHENQSPIRELSSPNDEEQQHLIENDSNTVTSDTEQNLNDNCDEKTLNGDFNDDEYDIENPNNDDYKTPSSPDKISVNDIQPSPEIEQCPSNTKQSCSSSPIDIKITDEIPSPFSSPMKLEQILGNDLSTIEKDSSNDNASEFFYSFQPENFHAEQGAPYVCTTCNGIGHLKTECPELIVPKMIEIPKINDKWFEILSKLCYQITERCKPKQIDIDKRKEILQQLEHQFQQSYPECNLYAFGSFYNGFGFQHSDLDVCIVFKDERERNNEQIIQIMQRILRSMRSTNIFENVQPVLHAKVPIIRSKHKKSNIEIDISLHNMLAIENTRLLKTYTDIDSRTCQLGYMIKHLAKFCYIGDASKGTLSSYAYIIMLIHFLQQIQPPVLPVLQQLSDPENKTSKYKKCSKWNVYFFDDLSKINQLWKTQNKLSTGELWSEFLRFYTEQFNYDEHVVTIRQKEPLLKHEKGWFRQTIAIEDPFELSHNLAGGLSPRNWTLIRRVFIRARQQFCVQNDTIDITCPNMSTVEEILFNIDELCPTNAPKRCEWCKGPYHIRKRCPKLATLAGEQDKHNRSFNNNNHHHYSTNNSQQNSNRYMNKNPSKNDHNNHHNGRHYPKSAPTNQGRFRYDNENGLRELNHSHNVYRSHPQNNSSARQCFNCGSFDHIRVNCPSPKKIV